MWRTALAVTLVAWVVTAIGGAIAAWRLVEDLPPGGALLGGVLLFAVAPALLLAWSFWTMLRDPVTGWMAPAFLLAFGSGLIPAFGPLMDVGMRMNFEAHRPVYEQIVADQKAGRLARGVGWVSEERDTVRFRYRADRPGEVDFIWARDPFLRAGVRYDDTPCRPTAKLRCVDRGTPLRGPYTHYGVIAAGLLAQPTGAE